MIEPRDRLVRSLLLGAIVGAVVVSIGSSILGASLLPPDARVVRHSSGSTWSRSTALVGFPTLVGAFALAAAISWSLAKLRPAAVLAAVGVFLASWQAIAFIAAR